MARRGGKAANRKAKQRKAQRPANPPRPAPPAGATATEESFAAEPMRAEAPAAVATPAARESAPRESTRKVTRDPRAMVAGPSRLSERAQQEYHYVQRDLRNIGVLVVIMAAILAVAYIVFNVMGIARAG
ncbi:MAG TPA: hypothetical protein VFN14_06500 [Candidatus Limnocylindria bacterium]|nr:hypothetical protein [Candidatus Limnocylindria bacterium]